MSLRFSVLACACVIYAACAGELSSRRDPARDPASPQAEEAVAPKLHLNDPDPTLTPPPAAARIDERAAAHDHGDAPKSRDMSKGHDTPMNNDMPMNHDMPTNKPTNHDKSMNHGDHAAPKMYTCPMHPDVRSAQPGSCPKCGMTLVPVPDDNRGHQ